MSESNEPSGAVLGPGSHPANANVAEAREYVEIAREVDEKENADRARAEIGVRQVLGSDYEPGLRLINRYLNGLPPAEREKIENEVLPSGVRALQDPKYLIDLGLKAMGPLPKTRAEVDELIAKAEERMRTDRAGWFRDEKAQLLYRFSLAAREKLRAR